jgi:hypothetical protein
MQEHLTEVWSRYLWLLHWFDDLKLLGLCETLCDIHAVDFSGVSAVSGRATIRDCPAVKFQVDYWVLNKWWVQRHSEPSNSNRAGSGPQEPPQITRMLCIKHLSLCNRRRHDKSPSRGNFQDYLPPEKGQGHLLGIQKVRMHRIRYCYDQTAERFIAARFCID